MERERNGLLLRLFSKLGNILERKGGRRKTRISWDSRLAEVLTGGLLVED